MISLNQIPDICECIVLSMAANVSRDATPDTGEISSLSGIEVARGSFDHAAVLRLVGVKQRGYGLGGI